jgi:23S rRNA (guanosine2251-2'-O)-methyltransferase
MATQDQNETLLYGIHAVQEAVASRPNSLDRIYFDNSVHSPQLFELLKTCRSLRLAYQVVPQERMRELAGSAKHQGVIATCPAKDYADIETVLASLPGVERPLLFVPASIEDPRNLGAVVRSCVAFGVNAILLEHRNTAPLTAVVAKASAGMLEHIPLCRPRNLERILTGLRDSGYAIVGMEAGAAKTPGEANLTGPLVLISGGEHRGVPSYLRKICTDMVGIPVSDKARSLNVSVAAGIVLYECSRQRNLK